MYLVKGCAARKVAQRFTGVDPLADQRSWVSPYNYVQNNPISRIDPDGALDDPIHDAETGEFLGHYGDTDFDGEILLMDRVRYEILTEGNDVVLSYEIAEQNGTMLLDIFEGKDLPEYSDLKLLSSVFTSLLTEASNQGVIDFDPSKLRRGRIGVSGAEEFTYPPGLAYNTYGAIANTGPIELDGSFLVWLNVQYYDEELQYVGPHLKYLSHAGNAISILGIHEYELHGVAGLQGNHNHYKIYPIQWDRSKDFISDDYREVLRIRKEQ